MEKTKIGPADKIQQDFERFRKPVGAGKQIARAVERGERVCRSAGFCIPGGVRNRAAKPVEIERGRVDEPDSICRPLVEQKLSVHRLPAGSARTAPGRSRPA